MRHTLGLALALLVLAFAATAHSTAQISETLMHNGTEQMMFSTPLESYFDREHPRPDHILHMGSTACWRGYAGKWEIKDGTLWLNALNRCHGKEEIPLAEIFPGQEGPLKATWFTGSLKIPQGRQTMYVHMGFASQYERWLYIEIEKGRVVRETVVTPPPEGFDRPPRRSPLDLSE